MTPKSSKRFIFQTGHGKGLAKTEILALGGHVLDEVKDGFLVEIEMNDPQSFLNRMGGIVRITEVLQEGPARMPLNFVDWVSKAIQEKIKDKSAKIRYGISMHPKSEKILKNTLVKAKKNLKPTLGNLRFVNKDFQNLSSVQAWHEHLLEENAIELTLFKSEEDDNEAKWYLSQTLAIQDFERYSKRDYDRPAKSAKNGMFPPKLAQILINLATENEQKPLHIYDPFCGSGTVLQEAWLMGLNTSGSDLAEQMVKDSKENLDWLKSHFNLEGAPPVIFEADATQITKDQLPKEPFCIVTETWLGPLMTQPPTSLERSKLQREIEALYDAFFSNLKKIAPGVTVVFTAAYYKEKNDRHFLPNLPEILKKHCEIIPLSEHKRPSLFYERKNQVVGREIWKVKL